MTKVIYLFSLSVALFSFILGTLNSQISLFTCFVRSSIVFLGILFVFSIGGQFLRWIVKHNEESTALQVQARQEAESEVVEENQEVKE
ncbi:MAG: hypothetical protein JXQ65_07750 [Candidatus Marinimicrobia bacterium]|nr:hypothetical protein [Candidatus Neomarinimicrobiota bacterium]